MLNRSAGLSALVWNWDEEEERPSPGLPNYHIAVLVCPLQPVHAVACQHLHALMKAVSPSAEVMWMQTSMFEGEALRRFWSKESDLCPFLDGDTLQRGTDCEGCYFFIHLSSWQFPVIVSNILESEEEEDRGRLRKDTEDVQKLLFKEKRLKNSRLTQAAYLFSLSNQNRARRPETIFDCQVSLGGQMGLTEIKA